MAKSSILGIEQVAENQSSKHITINDATNTLEAAHNARLAVTMTTGDVTLTEAQFTGSYIFQGTGHSVARILTLPIVVNTVVTRRTILVENAGTADLSVRGGAAPVNTVIIPAAGKALLYCAGNTLTTLFQAGGSTVTGDEVNFGVFVPTKPDNAVEVVRHIFVRAVTFPGNFVGSRGTLRVNPTGSISYGVFKNGANVGSIDISTGGVYTFTSAGGVSVPYTVADVLTIIAPAVQDATAADFGITLKGTKA